MCVWERVRDYNFVEIDLLLMWYSQSILKTEVQKKCQPAVQRQVNQKMTVFSRTLLKLNLVEQNSEQVVEIKNNGKQKQNIILWTDKIFQLLVSFTFELNSAYDFVGLFMNCSLSYSKQFFTELLIYIWNIIFIVIVQLWLIHCFINFMHTLCRLYILFTCKKLIIFYYINKY